MENYQSIDSWRNRGKLLDRQGDTGIPGLGYEWLRMESGVSAGVDIVILTAGETQVLLVPTRGLSIAFAERRGIRFGWDSPVQGPVHPQWVPIAEPSGLGFLDGFDEMLVRCGLNSNGAPEFDNQGTLKYPLHGRIANLPAINWNVALNENQGTVVLNGTLQENRFHFCRWTLETTIEIGTDNRDIRMVDRVHNHSNRAGSFQMLYHANFGTPILQAGSRLHAPVTRLVPRNEHAADDVNTWDQFGPPDPSYAEQVYFMQLAADDQGQTIAVLANEQQTQAVSVAYNVQQLPCFSLWKNTVGTADGYVAGLEPATNFPNPRSFEESAGRVVTLQTGQSYEMALSIGLLEEPAAVGSAIRRVNDLSPDSPKIENQPADDWCS